MASRRLNPGRAGCIFAGIALAAAAAGPVRADTDAWINGTADFLLDRANANFLYIFQSNLRGNAFFRDYFPATGKLIARTDLRVLLADKKLIRNFLDSDVATFVSGRVDAEVDKLVSSTPYLPRLKGAVADAGKALSAVDPKREKPATRKLEAIGKALDGLTDADCKNRVVLFVGFDLPLYVLK